MWLRGIFWVIIFFGGTHSLAAQAVYISENQLVSLSDGAILSTYGSITNDGALLNQGEIYVSGDWNNQQSYGGSGWLYLVGSEDQVLSHNNQRLGSLGIDGGGGKVLDGNITITDTLSLVDGLIVAANPNIPTLEETAEVVNASARSYIQGAVRFRGTGYHFIPTGTASAFLPVTLEEVTGVNPEVEIEAFSEQQLEVTGENLEAKTVSNYWNIEVVDGSYGGTVVTLPVTATDDFDDIVGTVIAEADDLSTPFDNLGQGDRQGDRDSGVITSELASKKTILALGLTSDYAIENSVEVPSAFSPLATNPDDRTVRVYAANLRVESFSFTVFNRWGQVIYQTTELQSAQNSGWDGLDTNTNQPLPSGVYPYVLRGIYDTGQAVEKTGSITLFR
ncbi:MAG: gliding motility-associated C-terminal domain-containing protein [Bacteroidota bacterium]